MALARAVLIVLGIAFAVAGVVIARTVDPLFGLGGLIVGAFLLILPFITYRSED